MIRLNIRILLIALLIPLALGANESIISYLEGDVLITRQGEELPGDFGLELQEGDVISTGSGGLVIIELKKNRILKVTENTLLILETIGKDTNLNLKKGSLFAKIKNLTTDSFSVSTDTVVAGIRGTEFFVAHGRTIEDNPDIWLCVNEGAVQVGIRGTDNTVLVNEGEGINILSGKELTEPRFFPWTEDLNWNTDPFNGSVENKASLDSAYSDLLDQDYF